MPGSALSTARDRLRDKATKKFFERYQQEHDIFQKSIQGISDEGDQRWYASVLLNRLMFVYFLQGKGLLDHNPHYLQDKLEGYKSGDFYHDFLCPLFFEGFASREHNQKTAILLGSVPYLNSGVFEKNALEKGDGIHIANEAFERILSFFSEYNWRLDNRPFCISDKEINPDVLGHIFEKYINQKELGAYYTKEDITSYICRSTILPYLFETIHKKEPAAYQAVWACLRDNPDGYIFAAVRHGVNHTLPQEIQAGVADSGSREHWNEPADTVFALPAETWREVIRRRQHYQEVYDRMKSGAIHEIKDFITDNLDIERFAEDVIRNSKDTGLVRAFYQTLTSLTILDPTCGSGAFLFAAISILQPLYRACLDRMEEMLADQQNSGEPDADQQLQDFREELESVQQTANRESFILRSIIVKNLYGVDIMPEAVEVCKLRLYLRLIAQAEKDDQQPNGWIEPLPDIDFNIISGNALVGYARYEDVEKNNSLDFQQVNGQIKEKARDVDSLRARFCEQQAAPRKIVDPFCKQELADRVSALEETLNRLLAQEYGVDLKDYAAYLNWKNSHRPLHWFVKFYGIMERGGFDVIVGNPPYVEYSKVMDAYKVMHYETIKTNNLYAFVTERSISLLAQEGLCGFIVPISAFSNRSMQDFQRKMRRFDSYIASFHQRPAQLFEGVLQRLSIFILDNQVTASPTVHTTNVKRWYARERSTLFNTLFYIETIKNSEPQTCKVGDRIELSLLEKVAGQHAIRSYLSQDTRREKNFISYRTAGGGYWLTFLNSTFETESLSNKTAAFLPQYNARVLMAVLNSSLFWWYYFINYDLFNLKDYMIFSFRFTYPGLELEQKLCQLAEKLEADLLSNGIRYPIHSKTRGDTYTWKYQNAKSKPILDEIDHVLAAHYGFTKEEVDFIINYDMKFRCRIDAEH